MKLRKGLLDIIARERPPEMPDLGSGADWKFETRALAADFKHFEVKAEANRPTVSIFDYIGDDGEGGGVTAKRMAGALRGLAGRDLTVEINSPGGNYFEGVAIYNLLRRHDGDIRVEVLGIAASAASVIAMAGDEIAIAHNAEIMIHEAQGLFIGTKTDMKDACETLEHLDTAMCETYAARTGRPAGEFAAMIAGKDVFFRGQEAINAGLADIILNQDAEPVIYAAADEFPSDKASLDRFLAKHDMPRSARRDLFRAIGTGKSSAAAQAPATPRAGDEPGPDYSRLITALTV